MRPPFSCLLLLLLAACSHEAAPPKAIAAAPGERQLIQRVELSLSVTSAPPFVRELQQIATTFDGRLSDLTRTDRGGEATLLVPAARLEAALETLRGLGSPEFEQRRSEDVTAATADLTARLATARAFEERLRGLVQVGGSVAELVTLESKLSEVRGQIESLEAQRKALAAQVEYATVHLTFSAAPELFAGSYGAALSRSLRGSVEALGRAAMFAGLALVALAPWAAVAALAWAGRRLLRRAVARRPQA